MSLAEVEAIVGPAQLMYRTDMYPTNGAENAPDTGGRWSHSPGDTHFRNRVLLFRNGIVVRKHSEYYID
jgi:hypothetical protein